MRRFGLCLVLLSSIRLSVPAAETGAPAYPLRVDLARTNGWIRPLHGVNGGPLCYRGTVDLTQYHRELGIPLTRLHDVPWVNAEAVDIHIIFPDFRNDPQREESYQFSSTDDYIAAITNVPSQIVYRLGESIEHTARKYHVHPPPNPAKWAAVCLGVIRHYNAGWAHGFRHNIAYWEIWNEPDIGPAMWTGTDEQFFQLFDVTAKAIKKAFPEVKVGGPALGSSGQFVGHEFKPSPFLTRFLTYCREHQVPLDFFSWHRYTSRPWDLPRHAQAVRLLLDQAGFAQTESHLNEWNYLPDDDWAPLVSGGQGIARERWYNRMSGAEGAAFVAAALALLQDAPIDAANYYTGEVQGFGLFQFSGVPKSSYYAFKAFRELLNTPVRVRVEGVIEPELTALAGINPEHTAAAVLISALLPAGRACELAIANPPWKGLTQYQLLSVDSTRNLEELGQGMLQTPGAALPLPLRGPAVLLVRLRSE